MPLSHRAQLNLNKLGDTFLACVSYERLQRTIAKLHLPNNCVSDVGATHLIKAMEKFPFEELAMLNLSGNQIGDEVMMRLFDAVLEREKLEGGANVQGNPCKACVLQAVEERQLNPQVTKFLETLSQSK